ncbi:tryptophan transporter [Peribacillus loiseleuriae]|uniref:tryptophan transporter n=1 Tax=Peribacillus loiseleuriae TaxID=1679170 RepID=UPI0037F42C5A
MNTKVLVSLSLLMGLGAVLHLVVPGFAFGVKPDMMLTMMFLAIILFPEKKNVFLVAVAAGVISGLTTTFPGGFIPNIIDKFISAFLFYFMFLAIQKFTKSIISIGVLTAVGTIISGTVFLTSAYFLAGLPKSFLMLFSGAVLPAIVLNVIAMAIIYPIVTGLVKRSNIPANI